MTLAWFAICFVVGVILVVGFALTQRYDGLAFAIAFTVVAGAFAVSEWRSA